MQCPKCFGTDVSPIGTSHYVCNNPNCTLDNGSRTQFRAVEDTKVRFPYNQIFVNRGKDEFIRKPYLEIKSVGVESV